MHEFKLEDHVLIFSTLQNYNKYWKSTIKNRAGYIKFRVSQQNSYLLHSFLYPFFAQVITKSMTWKDNHMPPLLIHGTT